MSNEQKPSVQSFVYQVMAADPDKIFSCQDLMNACRSNGLDYPKLEEQVRSALWQLCRVHHDEVIFRVGRNQYTARQPRKPTKEGKWRWQGL